MEEALVEALREAPIRLGEGATGRSATIRAPVQVPDTLDEREYTGARLGPCLHASDIDLFSLFHYSATNEFWVL
jgi:hypothetical protein